MPMPLIPNRRLRDRAGLRSLRTFEVGARPYDLLTDNALWREHAGRLLPPGPPPRRVLDVGCGPGASAFALASRLEGQGLVVGLDRAAAMVELARRRLPARAPDGGAAVALLQGDALRLAFADGTFDLVTGHSLLYLLPDQAAALREMARVLRPGGSLALLEPSAGGSLRRAAGVAMAHAGAAARRPLDAARMAAAMCLWRVYSGAVGRFEPAALEQLLREAGLRDVRIEPTLGGLGLIARGTR